MTVDEIYSGMAARFQEETGLVPAGDGDLAVRLYAVAAQVQALYVQADLVGRQCFPQTAAGEFLDRHAQLRGLARRQAAGGEVRTFFIFDVECCLCSCPADRAREREIRWRVYRENAYCWGSPAGSRRIKWPMWPARCARPERMSMSL